MIDIKTVCIAGGGASGLMATIACGRTSQGRIKITVLERMNRVGKKIPATGNGRCNFTNRNAASCRHYFGRDPKFAEAALSDFDVEDTLELFSELGIFPKEEGGKYFPYSDRAQSVLDALRFECERLGVVIRTDFDIKEIKKKKNGFEITSYSGEKTAADRVIVACGGCASPNLGSNGSGFRLLSALGHSITPLRPALVQLRLRGDFLKSLSGIKIKGSVGLCAKGHIIRRESGEVLFTDYGISGPPVFQLSAYMNGEKNLTAVIDFMPEYSEEQVFSILSARAKALGRLTMQDFFSGLFHKRIGNIIAGRAGIKKLSLSVDGLTEKELHSMARLIKAFDIPVEGTNGWNNAQVTAGGAATDEFDGRTMESKSIKGLFCCGEVLDIYGECGGYNLQWAWSSGYAAGKNAARSILCLE